MTEYKHSVTLRMEKCCGCTHCLKHCPTEAIRIRNGHAVIDPSRCIDCGECIRVCPHQAKRAVYDKLSSLPRDKYKIALPPPSLMGQFDNLEDMDNVLKGLLDCGFDDVYEVACAAEIVSDYTRRYMKRQGLQKPVISSACPVIQRLISLRYPCLADSLLPILPPMEVAAHEARRAALKKQPELRPEDMVVVFISPCPAKVSYIKNRGEEDPSGVDYVVSMADVYMELLGRMKKEYVPVPMSRTGIIGLNWASTGGEATGVFSDRYLAADGIVNVLRVLEELDSGSISGLDFVELNACPGGCVGGVMTVINPFIAKARLRSLRRYLPVSQNWASDGEDVPNEVLSRGVADYRPVTFGTDRSQSIQMMSEVERLCAALPGIDCGSCGAPTCRAFALDVVRGDAKEEECTVCLSNRQKAAGDGQTPQADADHKDTP